ncbi:phage tail tip protein J-related protein [Aeromonas jandaei]|uniref:phage tail tip protein J-related protein n=1 Tax=Aeromonas jandaei TaxID=650 RepID=UPI003BA2AC0B
MPAAAIPVIAGIAAGAASTLVVTTATAIAIGSAVMSATMMLTMKKPSLGDYRSASERSQVLRAAASDKSCVYGRVISSGLMSFAAEEPGEQDEGEWLHMALVLAGTKLSRIGNVWLGDDLASTYGDLVSWELHTDRQTCDPFMLERCADWKEDMIGQGITWLRMSLKFNAEKFPSGLPNIKIEKFGKTVWDPRDGAWKWSDNPALVILDYYRSWLKVPDDELRINDFIVAANICDEMVTVSGGKMEPRYTINAEFDLTEPRAKVLEAMHMTCCGQPTYIGGKFGILAGAYYGPASDELHPHQLVGDLELLPEPSSSDKINQVAGTFVDPTTFKKTDFPAVIVPEWVEEDGGYPLLEDLDLRFVTSEYQAQRIANIILRQRRNARTITCSVNLSGWRYRPGQTIRFYLPAMGINGPEFRVSDWAFSLNGGVDLTLREDSPLFWADAIGKPMERPDITELPSGGIAAPDQLRYEVEQIGETVQGRLYWRNVGQVADNRVIVQHLEPGQPPRTVLTVAAPGDSCPLNGLVMGSYTAQVRAVGYTGRLSPPAAVHFTIEAPVTPVGIDVEAGNWTLALRPVWYGGAQPAAMCEWWFSHVEHPITEAMNKAKWVGIAPFMTLQGLRPDTEYYVWLRTVNAYGKSELLAAKARTAYDIESILDMMDGEIGAEHLREELRKPIESIKDIALDVDNIKDGITEITGALEDGSLVQSLESLKVSADSAAGAGLAAALAGAESDQNQRKNVGMLTVRQEAMANEQEAQATRIVTLGAQVDDNHAAILQESSVRATADRAIASHVTQVEAKVGETSAAVKTVSEAVADVNGEVRAGWYTKAQINGQGGGFGLSVEMSSDGSVLSSFVIDADVFAVLSRADGPTSKRHPFMVKNGRTYIDSAMMDMAEVGTLISDYVKVKQLDAATITNSVLKGSSAAFGRGGPYPAFGETWHTVISSDGQIKTNRLFAEGAFVDTLNIKGNAITVPVFQQVAPGIKVGPGTPPRSVGCVVYGVVLNAPASCAVMMNAIMQGNGMTNCTMALSVTNQAGGQVAYWSESVTVGEGNSFSPTMFTSVEIPAGIYNVELLLGNNWHEGDYDLRKASFLMLGIKR